MGFILSKFRKKKSTQEVLEKLENEIKRIQTNKRQSLVTQSTVVRKILTYGLVFWVLASGCIFYLYRSAQKSEDYLIFLPILVLIPCFLIIFRKVLTWWYHSKINKDDAKLSKLQDEKCKILDDVMEKETYKIATQILEKYDPSRLAGKPTDVKLPGLSNNRGGGAQPMVVAAASNRGRGSQLPPPNSPGKGMDLRKRIIPPAPNHPPPPGLNQSIPLPNARKEGAPVNLNQTIGSVGRTPVPPPGMGRGGMPPGMMRGGPPLPRPIIPRERGIMDRMVEYLVGDGPSNRYALICRQCQSHNGMALREEFEYISYRCCYCHYWNPARKQRPMAPRLPLPPPESPLPSRKSQGSEKGSPKVIRPDAQIKEVKSDETDTDTETKEKELSGEEDIKEDNGDTENDNLSNDANNEEQEKENQDVNEEVEKGNSDEDHQVDSDSPVGLDGPGDLESDGPDHLVSEHTDQFLPDENPDDFENLNPNENSDQLVSYNQNPDDQGEMEGIEPLKMEFSEHIELINKDVRTEIEESSVSGEPLLSGESSGVPDESLLPNESTLPDESSVPLLLNMSNKSDAMDVDS